MSARKPSRSKRPSPRRSKALRAAPPVDHFRLVGDRTATHKHLLDLAIFTGSAVAWARPGAEPLVIVTATDFASLTGRGIPETTFCPSRFCRRCTAFTGGRRCRRCNPPVARVVRATRSK